MHQQTAKALEDRSEKAIRRLRPWINHLREEMLTQERPPDNSGPNKRYKDMDDPHPETITFKWVDVDNLIADLRKSADELQEFTK